MSRVKDLMHAILNENIEDIDEEEEVVEEVVEETVKEEPQPTFVAPKIKPIKEPQVDVAEFTAPAVEEKPARKPSIFDGMDFEDISRDPGKPKRRTYKYDRSKLSNKRRLQEDLEYTPIISPIFGNTVEEKKQFDKVHNAIDLGKPEDELGLTKIISPMYGNNIPTPKPVSSIPTKEVVVEEVKEDITLSDMLEKTPKETAKQETLFGNEE